MPDRYDEYRRRAKEAQDYADRAIGDVDRASWLKMVQGWLSMIPGRAENELEKFDSAVDAHGMEQKDNESPN